jgi:hypothetical protein
MWCETTSLFQSEQIQDTYFFWLCSAIMAESFSMAGVEGDDDAKDRCKRRRPHTLKAWREAGIMVMIVSCQRRARCNGAIASFCEKNEESF